MQATLLTAAPLPQPAASLAEQAALQRFPGNVPAAKKWYELHHAGFQWQDNGGSWCDYNDDTTKWQLVQGTQSSVQVTIGMMLYVVDLEGLSQINLSTNKVRKLRRTASESLLLWVNVPAPPAAALGAVVSYSWNGAQWIAPPNQPPARPAGGFLFGAGGPRAGGGGLFGGGGRSLTPVGDSLFGPDECERQNPEASLQFQDEAALDLDVPSNPFADWRSGMLQPVSTTLRTYNYAAVCVDKNSTEFSQLQAICGHHQLQAAFRIQNNKLRRRWEFFREELHEATQRDAENGSSDKSIGQEAPSMQVVFHGTRDPENLNHIADSGFDVIYSASENSINAYGHGVYFASEPTLAMSYGCSVPTELRAVGVASSAKVVFCALLCTSSLVKGKKGDLKPPVISQSKSGRRYDTFCNHTERPSILVATDNAQAYPAYMICLE